MPYYKMCDLKSKFSHTPLVVSITIVGQNLSLDCRSTLINYFVMKVLFPCTSHVHTFARWRVCMSISPKDHIYSINHPKAPVFGDFFVVENHPTHIFGSSPLSEWVPTIPFNQHDQHTSSSIIHYVYTYVYRLSKKWVPPMHFQGFYFICSLVLC